MKNQYKIVDGSIVVPKGTYVVVQMKSGKKYVGDLLEDYKCGNDVVISGNRLSCLPLAAVNVEYVAPTSKDYDAYSRQELVDSY